MIRPRLWWLVVLVPVSLWTRYGLRSDVWTFAASIAAIVPLADLIGRSTDQLALHAGPRVGGLATATLGNLTELIIGIFLVRRGEFEVVKASLTGSILSNLLLVLGLAFIAGGIKHTEQRFNARAASVHTSSMALAVAGLLMPALFVLTTVRSTTFKREVVSVTVAVVLLVLYAAALVFTLITHEHLFRTPAGAERPSWTVARTWTVLLAAAAAVAVESELLVGSLEPAVRRLGVTRLFVGLIVVPLAGNAAERASAVYFALRDRLDVTLEIAIGSSTQIALFVAPALVFVSLAFGRPMDFVFSPFEVAAVAMSTVIVAIVLRDGQSDWLEGGQLVGAYVIIAVSFLFFRTPR